MNLTKLEFKKIFTPLTLIAIAVMLAVNLYATFMFQGVFYVKDSDGPMSLPEYKERISRHSGAITPEWIAARNAEVQAILNDPENQKNEEEMEELRRELVNKGYSDAMIEDTVSRPQNRLNAKGLSEYDQTEFYIYAANFYNYAEEEKQYLLDRYASDEAVCADITERYDRLINGYTAYYDYDLAYSNIQYAAANVFPFTIGVPVLIGLAPLFARERARKTDALILSSKRGRCDVARAKICAGALFTVLVWFIMAASVTAYAFIFFGAQGFGGLWQSFTDITSPFSWTFGQAVIIELLTCLAGTLFFAFVVILFSELTRSMFVAVILGAALLITPMVLNIISEAAMFLPTLIMRGVAIWSAYFPAKLFGSVVPLQYVALSAALIVSAACAAASILLFDKRQAS